MRRFESLRVIPWDPQFVWQPTHALSAVYINMPHEDYPSRVQITDSVLASVRASLSPSTHRKCTPTLKLIKDIHSTIFYDKSFAGEWRTVDVRVGNHKPPSWESVSRLMKELIAYHAHNSPTVTRAISGKSVDFLIDYYYDLLTIHPYQDGNGRVAAVILSAYSNLIAPELGWLAPLQ